MTEPNFSGLPAYPDKDQVQATFDANWSAWHAAVKDEMEPNLALFVPWANGIRDQISASLLAGDLPDMTGHAGKALAVNAAEDAVALLPLKPPRNYAINGSFEVWQRGTSQTSGGIHSADRWYNNHAGASKTVSQQEFSVGQTDVPGSPHYFMKTDITTPGNNPTDYVSMLTRIEDVTALAGKDITVTFWAKAASAMTIGVSFDQLFGTGGSPSPARILVGQTVGLGTSWQKVSLVFTIPSVSSKTLGTDGYHTSCTQMSLWLSGGTNYTGRVGGTAIGHNSGAIDVARLSVCVGDLREHPDPFEDRSYGEELALCQRYYAKGEGNFVFPCVAYSYAATYRVSHPMTMRTAPTLGHSFSIFANAHTWAPLQNNPDSYDLHVVGAAAGNTTATFTYTANAEL